MHSNLSKVEKILIFTFLLLIISLIFFLVLFLGSPISLKTLTNKYTALKNENTAASTEDPASSPFKRYIEKTNNLSGSSEEPLSTFPLLGASTSSLQEGDRVRLVGSIKKEPTQNEEGLFFVNVTLFPINKEGKNVTLLLGKSAWNISYAEREDWDNGYENTVFTGEELGNIISSLDPGDLLAAYIDLDQVVEFGDCEWCSDMGALYNSNLTVNEEFITSLDSENEEFSKPLGPVIQLEISK